MKQLPPFTMWLEVNNHTGRPKHQQPAQTKSGSLAPGSNTAAQPSQRPALSTVSLYIGELSAAFLLGHLSRVSWPLGLAPVLYLNGIKAPAEPCLVTGVNLGQKTPPRVQQHCPCCCCFIPGDAQPAQLSTRDMPLKQSSAPAAAPTCVSPGQHREQLPATCPQAVSTVPCGVTSWAQGMPLFAAANSRSRAEHRHCTSLLGWSKRSCQQESSHTADKAWGENGIRDSKKFQTTSSDPALSPFNAKKASIKHVTETWQPRGWSNFTWNNICSLGNYLTENTMTECLWKMWIF